MQVVSAQVDKCKYLRVKVFRKEKQKGYLCIQADVFTWNV